VPIRLPKVRKTKAIPFHNILRSGSRIARIVRLLLGVVVRGGAFVKSIRWFLILIVLGLSSSAALADAIDPALGVKGDGDASAWTGSISVFMSPSTVGVTCTTNGLCNFVSATFNSTVDITDFDYLFSESQSTAFSVVDGSIFPTLTIISGVGTAFPEAILSGGTICGIFDEVCESGVTDFYLITDDVVEGSTLTITSNVPIGTPEPGTMILVVAGLGLVGLRHRRQKTFA
jgi:hypothetical protein